MKKSISIILVVAVAAVLTYFALTKGQAPAAKNQQPGKVSLPAVSQQEAQSVLSSGLSAVGNDQERLRYAAAVRALATTSSEIVLTDCKPNPEVLLVPKGGKAIIKNAGTSTADVRIGPTAQYQIAPNATATVEGLYDGRTISYTYSCGLKTVGSIYFK